MEGDFIKINHWLTPLSWLYGLGVGLRNFCFDVGILKSRAFSVPVISVGNITVGGTGKTPHVEYLVRLMKDRLNLAVLSRGYKRKTRGFKVASEQTTARDVGDEPMQMKRKFPSITVAVCKKRTKGIERLMQQDADIDAIVLDDAFQHRYVKPGINILLVDYHRLIIYDTLLPAGRLREPLSGKNRADIVVITKCPKDLKPMDFRVITKAMGLFPYQHLFFTTLDYDAPHPLFAEAAPGQDDGGQQPLEQDEHLLLLTGIASPDQLLLDLAPHCHHITPMTFADHHDYSKRDIRRLQEAFEALPQPRRILTTEKDAARLLAIEDRLSQELREALWVLPVRIRFMQDQEEKFNENIIGYVRKNSRNSILAKGKDDHKPDNGHRPGDRPRTISFRNY